MLTDIWVLCPPSSIYFPGFHQSISDSISWLLLIDQLLTELEMRQHLERSSSSSSLHFMWINKMWYHSWTQAVIKHSGLPKCSVVDVAQHGPTETVTSSVRSPDKTKSNLELSVYTRDMVISKTGLFCWSYMELPDCTWECLKSALDIERMKVRRVNIIEWLTPDWSWKSVHGSLLNSRMFSQLFWILLYRI